MAEGQNQNFSASEIHAIHLRMEKFDTNIGRVFDMLNEVRITLATNTKVLEDHHGRSIKLERIQALLQRRNKSHEVAIRKITDTLSQISADLAALELNLQPIQTEVEETKKVKIFLGGFAPIAKWLTIICTAFISVYGLIAIFKDMMGK